MLRLVSSFSWRELSPARMDKATDGGKSDNHSGRVTAAQRWVNEKRLKRLSYTVIGRLRGVSKQAARKMHLRYLRNTNEFRG